MENQPSAAETARFAARSNDLSNMMTSINDINEDDVPSVDEGEVTPAWKLRLLDWGSWFSVIGQTIKNTLHFNMGTRFPQYFISMFNNPNQHMLELRQFNDNTSQIRLQDAQIIVRRRHCGVATGIREVDSSSDLDLDASGLDLDLDAGLNADLDASKSISNKSIDLSNKNIEAGLDASRPDVVVREIDTTHRMVWFLRKCNLSLEDFQQYIKRVAGPDVDEQHQVLVRVKYRPDGGDLHDLTIDLDRSVYDLEVNDRKFANRDFLFGIFTLPSQEAETDIGNLEDLLAGLVSSDMEMPADDLSPHAFSDSDSGDIEFL